MRGKTKVVAVLAGLMAMVVGGSGACAETQCPGKPPDFSMGMAVSSEECGSCDVAIYREYAMGFGGDVQYRGIVYKSAQGKLLKPISFNACSFSRSPTVEGRCVWPNRFNLVYLEC